MTSGSPPTCNTHVTASANRLAAAHAARARRAATGERAPDPIARAKTKPTSLRLAVTAKCWDCVGADADPNPRGRIRECPAVRCPLHPVRPYQRTDHKVL